MNRRIALRNLGFITAGALLLPSCGKEVKAVTIALKNIAISGDQEAVLAEIVNTLIPATDIPGAKDFNVHQFVLHMVDDCYSPESQQEFVNGLAQVDGAAEKKYNKSFLACSPEEKAGLINSFDELKDKKEEGLKADPQAAELASFFSITKGRTIQGYLSSEYIMTKVLVHRMIPGKFSGCVEIKDKNDILTVIG